MLQRIQSFIKEKLETRPPLIGDELIDCHAAILVTDGFEESELFDPRSALASHGCKVSIISLMPGKIHAWTGKGWGKSINVDLTISEARGLIFDFLVIPGGIINADTLRGDREAVTFVRSFLSKNRPVAAICHGPQLLIETDLLEGRTLTSYPSIKTDLMNAGASWTNKEVVVDKKLITSRYPDDIPAFNREMIRVFLKNKFQETILNTESFIVIL
jgi:protease I